MPSVVLITGVSRFLGSEVAARLSTDPNVDRLIGVDTIPPRPSEEARLGRTEFVRADISNPLIAKVIAQARVTTVVHTAPHARSRALQVGPREQHVTGTMQLLAGCQVSESLRRVVVASTAAVYGSSSHNPAVFTESMPTSRRGSRAYARDAVEVENYTRGFTRRRPDIEVSVLRLANILGPRTETALARYLAMPIVPTSLGYDPRLQLLHEDDAAEAVRRASVEHHRGIVNVAGDGVVPLSQALRWAGRVRLPVPSRAISMIGGLVRNTGFVDVSAEEADFLNFGRVVDTERLHAEFGYVPQYTTAETLLSYLAARDGRGGLPRVGVAAVAGAQRLLRECSGAVPTAAGAQPVPDAFPC